MFGGLFFSRCLELRYRRKTQKLPSVLVPDAASFADAGLPGVEVFKLLPRGTYKDADGSYKDEGNPLGLRGGGAYYSFSRHSHSYNQVPQIQLEAGNLVVRVLWNELRLVSRSRFGAAFGCV